VGASLGDWAGPVRRHRRTVVRITVCPVRGIHRCGVHVAHRRAELAVHLAVVLKGVRSGITDRVYAYVDRQ